MPELVPRRAATSVPGAPQGDGGRGRYRSTVGRRAWLRVAPAILALAYGGNHFSVLLLLYRAREGYTSVAVDLLFALYVVGIVPGFLGPEEDFRRSVVPCIPVVRPLDLRKRSRIMPA